MSWPLAGKRDIKRWTTAGAIGAVLACTASPYAFPDLKIKLPPGVSADAAQFRNSIQQYQVTQTHERPRPATCSNCIVIVHIDVLGDTRTIDPDNPPGVGAPIAHLVNLDDTDTEAYYGLQPHSVAEYYVWVDDNGSRKSRATLLKVTGTTVSATNQWLVTLCHPWGPDNPRTGSDFDFYEYKHGGKPCTRVADVNTAQVNSAALISGTAFQSLFSRIVALFGGKMTKLRGDWIECSSGCCT